MRGEISSAHLFRRKNGMGTEGQVVDLEFFINLATVPEDTGENL